MANTLRFKRGLVSGIPTAALGEPLFTTDTFDLYIGNGTGNTRFQKYIASGTTSQLLRGDGSLLTMPIVLTSPSNGQVLKYDGTNWVNSADAGVTGSGTANYLSKWTSSSALGNSLVFDNGTNVLINTTTALWSAASRQTFEINGAAQSLLALNVANTSAGYLWHSGTYLSLANTRNSFISFVTNSAEYMRLHATGNLSLNSTTDNGLRFQVTGDGYFSGSVGIGSTSLTNRALVIGKTMTGSTSGYGILQSNTIASDVTSLAMNNYSQFTTQAAAFTITNAYHYYNADITVGSGSTITNQYGYFAANIVAATNNYGFYGNIASGTGRWNLYMNGTAANYLAGSLGLGITVPTSKLHISTTAWNSAQPLVSFVNLDPQGVESNGLYLQAGAATSGAYIANFVDYSGVSAFYVRGDRNVGIGLTAPTERLVIRSIGNAYANSAALSIENSNGANKTYITNAGGNFYISNSTTTDQFVLYTTGNLVLSGTSDTGERLQVNGTMRVSGASTFNANVGIGGTPTAFASYNVLGINGTAGGLIELQTNGTSTGLLFSGTNLITLRASTSSAIRFETNGNNERMRISSAGDVGIGTSSPAYKLDVTGEARVSNAIAIGTTPDTNKPFKILKNINGTVGINFENTSTGSLAFSAIQMGTDVSGGTKFTNLVYASSGVTASGVYNPDGTSLINNGSGGLNFLGTPIRFYTGGSNGVLRYLFDNEGAIQYTTTAPTTNAVDGYKQYSADVVAGNAAPHFRTENGAVIKLYQETTGVGNSIISLGGGNSVLDDTTFDGYTLRQIVKALRNQGILQ